MKSFLKLFIIFAVVFTSFAIPAGNSFDFQNEKNIVYADNHLLGGGNDGTAEGNVNPTQSPPTQDGPKDIGYLDCDWYDIGCGIVNFFQLLLITVGNFLVYVAGLFLDFFLKFTLQSQSYRDATFIAEGWEILRDITNIVFIFALLLMAFKMVLGQAGSDDKRRLVKTILVALTVNFSLFFTFLLVDVGNVLGYVFYNNIGGATTTVSIEDADLGSNNNTDGSTSTNSQGNDGSVQGNQTQLEDSVSLAIANKFKPQTILSQVGANNTTSEGTRLVLVFVVGVINVAVIYTFISVAFLMLGRTIGLYVTAVLAPLAFASITVPGMERLPYVGFQKWFNDLIKMAFMPAAFLFFLYLAVRFMNINIVTGDPGDGNFIYQLFLVLVPLAAIIAIILLSKRVASSLAGEIAAKVSGMVAKVAGGAAAVGLGVATGGAALAARGAVGAGASALNKSEGFKNWAENSKYGKYAHKGLNKLQTSSFDFRNTKAASFLGKRTGITATDTMRTNKGYTEIREEKKEKIRKEEKAFQEYLDKKETFTRAPELDNDGNMITAGPGNSVQMQRMRVEDVEDRILKTEFEKSKKEKDVKEARQELTDASNKVKNLESSGAPQTQIDVAKTEVTDAQNKLDSEKAGLEKLAKLIKQDKQSISAGSKKVSDRAGNEFEIAGRSERYLARRNGESYTAQSQVTGGEIEIENQKGTGYGQTRFAAKVGAGIGTILMPGAGTAIGAALAAGIERAVTQFGSTQGRNQRIDTIEKVRTVGGLRGRDADGRERDRELSRARYRSETKENKQN